MLFLKVRCFELNPGVEVTGTKFITMGSAIRRCESYETKFSRLLYSHVKRNGNSVTHNLAKHAICIPDFQVWIPSHIIPFLQLGVTHLC